MEDYTDNKPIVNPKLEERVVYEINQRTVDSPKKLGGDISKNWYNKGENHRLEKAYTEQGDRRWITRDIRVKKWVMDCDIEDIEWFTKNFSEIRIENYEGEYKQLDGSDLPVIRICRGYNCN